MAGIVDEGGRPRAALLHFFHENVERAAEAGEREIGGGGDVEAGLLQHRAGRIGVVERVRQLGDVLVGAIAHDEGEAPLLGHGRR